MNIKYGETIRSTVFCGLLLIGLAMTPAEFAIGGEFLWPNTFGGDGIVPPDAGNALGRPDGTIVDYLTHGTSVTYSDFSIFEAFDSTALASLLGVSVNTIESADFIAFEVYGVFFEHSIWTFKSGNFVHEVIAPGEALATGMIPLDNFASHFLDIETQEIGEFMQFALFDLGSVSGFAADFEVQVQGMGLPNGSPELESLAVLGSGVVSSDTSTWSNLKALYR
jgi:hypothetical protein